MYNHLTIAALEALLAAKGIAFTPNRKQSLPRQRQAVVAALHANKIVVS